MAEYDFTRKKHMVKVEITLALSHTDHKANTEAINLIHETIEKNYRTFCDEDYELPKKVKCGTCGKQGGFVSARRMECNKCDYWLEVSRKPSPSHVEDMVKEFRRKKLESAGV